MRVVSDLVLSRVKIGDRLVLVEDGVVVSGVWRKFREGDIGVEGVESGFEVRVVGVFREGIKYWCGYIGVEVEGGEMRFDVLGPDIWQVCERRV